MTSKIVEIRAYRLHPGKQEEFIRLFMDECAPMLERWGIDVVAFGPSLGDPDGAYLMRAFPALEDRQRQEDAFYESDEWRSGPREAVLACIVEYADAVIALDDHVIASLRPTVR